MGFISESDSTPIEKYSKVSSIFEVVPGSYSLSWNLVDKVPQLENYGIEMKIKLRLKKKVEVLPEIFERLGNATYQLSDNNVRCPFAFNLVDANGNTNIIVNQLQIDNPSLQDMRKKQYMYNKDQMMDFIKFLASEPGTEIDLVLYCMGIKSGENNCIDVIKNAQAIQCSMDYDDSDFERYIGKIVE